MEFTETRRLYQQLAAELKQRIESGRYPVGDKLPAERYIAEEMNVSRTVVREAIIMLEVEGYVDVRKGSGIHVVSNQQKHRWCRATASSSPPPVRLSCCRHAS